MTGYTRTTADVDGDFVVLIIGTKVHRWRDVRAWLPVFRAMPRMLRELERHPELGLLRAYPGWMFGGPCLVQYWRSYDHLVAYARDAANEHLPAWKEFNRATRAHGEAVGIFHETYRVSAGQWEAIYGAMPDVGLAGATASKELRAGSTSKERMRGGSPAPAARP